MVMAEHSQVWVGSEDSVIYIINVHSMSCNKQLTDHRAAVTGLVVHDGKKPRYQGPLGGRKGKSLAPRGVEGKGSWASPGKKCREGESAGDMCGLVLLVGKEKGAFETTKPAW